MDELTNNPMFQSGVLPFAIALICALCLRPLGWRWSGLGFAIALAGALFYITGFQLTPLTSTRKIILLAGLAVALGIIFDFIPKIHRYLPIISTLIGGAACVWLIWPVLSRLDGQAYWLMLGSISAYGAWMLASTESLRDKSRQAAAAALALGTGVSISAILGASALLGQLGGCVAAAAGAFVLLLLLKQPILLGSNFTLPSALVVTLVSVSAITYADLKWYALIPLVFIPLAVRIPVKESWHDSVKVIVTTLYAIPLAAASIYITWSMIEPTTEMMY